MVIAVKARVEDLPADFSFLGGTMPRARGLKGVRATRAAVEFAAGAALPEHPVGRATRGASSLDIDDYALQDAVVADLSSPAGRRGWVAAPPRGRAARLAGRATASGRRVGVPIDDVIPCDHN